MMNTLAPEIRELLDKDIVEAENPKPWGIAMGKVCYRNISKAKEQNPDISERLVLCGTPDEAKPVPLEQWHGVVWKSDLFAENGKFNGSAFTKDELREITGREVTAEEIEASSDDMETEAANPIEEFLVPLTKASGYVPPKDECKDSSYNAEGEEQVIPQKYCWLQGPCSSFTMYTDFNGKTLPQVWDAAYGKGFTDHSSEDLVRIAQDLFRSTIAPEVKELLEQNVDQCDDRWTIAMCKVSHRNASGAQQANPDVSLQFAMSGASDSAMPVDPEVWQRAVFISPMFSESGKLSGDFATKEQWSTALGRELSDDDVDLPCDEEEDE